MKIICQIYPCILIGLFACNNTPQGVQIENSKPMVRIKPIAKLLHNNNGLILANEMTLYDAYKNPIKTVQVPFGEYVTIDSISEEKFDLTNGIDRCNLHNFVKAKGDNIKGWVYGKYLFEAELKGRDTILTLNGITFKIIPTKNFNIGVYDEIEEGLSTCEMTYSPVLFYNSLFNKYEYLPIVDENYPDHFFTLDNHDGWLDKIRSIEYTNQQLLLNIEREYQEGFADIQIAIKIDGKQSTAKLLKISRREG